MGLLSYFGYGDPDPAPTSGLLGYDPAAMRDDARLQALMGLASGLLRASGPSFMPHSFGADLGAGLEGAVAGKNNAMKQAIYQQQAQSLGLQNQGTQNLLDYRRQMLNELGTDPTSPAGARMGTMAQPGLLSGAASGPSSGLLGPNPSIIPQTGNLMPGQDSGDILPGRADAGGATMRLPAVSAAGGAMPMPESNSAPSASPVPYAPKVAASPNGAVPLIDPLMAVRNARMALAYGDNKGAAVWLGQVKPAEGYQYFSDGSQRPIPGGPADPNTKRSLATEEQLGKNLQMRGPNGEIVNLPGAVAANSQMAGGVEGAKSRATLPAELTKIGATGAQTRLSQSNQAGYEPTTVTVQTGTDANGQPIYQQIQATKAQLPGMGAVPGLPVQSDAQKAGMEPATITVQTGTDANGQPIYRQLQTSKAALPGLLGNGPVQGPPVLSEQQKIDAQAGVSPTTMTVPMTGPDGRPVLDPNGQPLFRQVQTTQLRRAQAGDVPGLPELTPQQKAGLDVWTAQQKPVTVRGDTGSVVIPGAGQGVPGLPADGRPNTVLRVARPGASAEANPASALPGTVVSGKTTATVESEKKRADQMAEWQKASVGNQNLLQQLKSLSDVSQFYNTGKLSPAATDAAGWLSSVGANPEALLGDPSKGEEFNKIASNFLTQQVSNLSSQPAHAAFGTIGTGLMSGDKRPETNHDITAQLVARLRWETDLATESAQKFPNGVPSTTFLKEFTDSHPTQKYLDEARKDIPPFAGMSGSADKPIKVMGDNKLPPADNRLPSRWYAGKIFPGGRAMWDASRGVWTDGK